MPSETDTARIERLTGLAQIWSDCYFFHPSLTVPHEGWETRLLEAIPVVEAATTPATYAAALNEALLRHLGDPFCFAAVPPPAANTADTPLAGGALSSGFGYLRAGVAAKAEPGWVAALGEALAGLGDAPGVILDLRGPDLSAPDPWASSMWPDAFGFFVDAPLPVPGIAERVHKGWSGGPLGTYQETWELQRGAPIQPIRAPAWFLTVAHRGVDFASLPCFTGPLAVLVDDGAFGALRAALAALQLSGRAFIVHETAGRVRIEPEPMRLWGGVSVWLRLTCLTAPEGRVEPRPDRAIAPGDPAAAITIAEELLRGGRPPALQAEPFTIPPCPPSPPRPPSDETLSREQRLLGLLKVWRVVGEFFPHLEFADLRWPDVPAEWIPRVEAAASNNDYYGVLLEFCARLNDSHVNLNHPAAWQVISARLGSHVFPFRIEAVNGEAVVTRLYEGAAELGIAVGMVLTQIDGEPVAEIAAECARLVPASTPQSRDQRSYPLARLGPEGSTAVLTLRQGGDTRTIAATRGLAANTPMPPPASAEPVRWVEGFGYINLETTESREQAEEGLRSFLDAPGLILDMRGYPRCAPQFSIVPRLIDRPISSTAFQIPIRSGSIRTGMDARGAKVGWQTWNRSNYVVHPDPALHYGGPVVVLIDVRAVSSAEDFCIYMRNAGRATFVGSPTTGTNGDVTAVALPGGGAITFTGMRVTYADGARFQNIGILPDVAVYPTPDGIAVGRDEVLEAGIKTLRRLSASR